MNVEICSRKEVGRGDADIGSHQNLAEAALLLDSWGTKYKRDADMGNHKNSKINSPFREDSLP